MWPWSGQPGGSWLFLGQQAREAVGTSQGARGHPGQWFTCSQEPGVQLAAERGPQLREAARIWEVRPGSGVWSPDLPGLDTLHLMAAFCS